ncbi:testis-specific zinc finger protein topi [Drosophila tropicalis]|uniref:testis-specific zinc finger protein topi n=1 Tax=Drosophila tropicalis TaxID=46794 RepID=UPI0035AC0DCD
MSDLDLWNLQTDNASGEYTVAEIEVEDGEDFIAEGLQLGATVLASNEGDGTVGQVFGNDELSKLFASAPKANVEIPTEVVVQRTLADPALKQILQEADGTAGFDPEAEQLKIRDFLAGVNKGKMTMEESVFQAPRAGTSSSATTSRTIKCSKCNLVCDVHSISKHTSECEGDGNTKETVAGKQDKEATLVSKVEPSESAPPLSKSASERVLQENQIRLRRYIKDELKCDLTTGAVNSRTKKATKGPNECTMCERKFVHASGLVRHMEKHALDLIPNNNIQPHVVTPPAPGLHVVLKCNSCGRIFFNVKSATDHVLIHFPPQPQLSEPKATIKDSFDMGQFLLEGDQLLATLSQDICNVKSPLDSKMFETLIVGSVLQCEFCEYIFAGISELLLHSATHYPERRFECTACDLTMNTAKEASVHFQTDCVFMREGLKQLNVTLKRYFVCNVCELKFSSAELLQEHRCSSYHYFPRLSEHSQRLLLPCEFCEVNFESAHEIFPHNEEKHLNKKKREKEARNTGPGRVRQYLCDICGKSYTQSSHLWQHLRFHQGVKPFVCQEENCGRKFTIRPDLNDHIRKCHTGERPYHCLVCGKRFLTGSVFYQHRLIHRGERRYECDECGKRFYRADALKNHQRIHTGEKPYSCLFCTKTFRQRGDRDKHIRARHSHLDANSRLMMQMQKFQLEAKAKKNGNKKSNEPGPTEDNGVLDAKDITAKPEQQDVETSGTVIEEHLETPNEETINVLMDDNEVVVAEDVVYQESIQEDITNTNDDIIMSIFDPIPEPSQSSILESIPLLHSHDNAKVVVVRNNPSLPMFSDAYM